MRKRYLYWLIVFLYILFIFSNSFQTGEASGNMSAILTVFINRIIKIDFDNLHHIIRKLAHFIEYFILAILVIFANNKAPLFNNKFTTIFLFMVLVPLIDEFIQLFIDGRAGTLIDCIIDIAGYALYTLIYLLINRKKVDYDKWFSKRNI